MRRTTTASRRLLTPFAAAALLAIASPASAEVRRAVLVGIDKYVPTAAGRRVGTVESSAASGRKRGGWTDLDGAVNDVEAMRQVLISRFGFKSEDVHVLANAEATRDRITGEIRKWLIDGAAPGDVSLFFYAGHGSQVKNSKSAEADKMDESIVPADANTGRPDLRDKELARLFDEALDRKVLVTLVFDSCHSGSVGRGAGRPTKFRVLPPDERDVADPSAPVPPETRGALVLSAAQDFQFAAETRDDDNQPHGLFTWALLKTLRSMPVNENADRMFLQLRAIMQSGDTLQEPVLATTPERHRASLFGVDRPSLSGATVVAVQSVQPDGTVTLQGGLAAGVRKDAELRRVGDAPAPGLTLRVTEEQGLSRSLAVAIAGSTKDLQPGALFEVTKWTAPAGPALRVWIGPAGGSASDLLQKAQRFAAGASTPGLVAIDDPTTSAGPNNVVQWSGSVWQLVVPGKGSSDAGADPSPAALGPQLAADSSGARRILLNVPLPQGARLRLGAGTENDTVEMLSSPEHADYILVGRRHGDALEYAWVRPLVTGQDARLSALPARTDWITLGSDPAVLTGRLESLAARLGTIRTWLQLESPADAGRFPYHLALKNTTTGQVRTTGPAREGERYGLVLTFDAAIAGGGSIDQRYVYVFAIDSAGKSTLLFPSATGGNVENHLPAGADDQGQLSKEIALGRRELFSVTPPFGIDTYLMLTSATALPDPAVLEGDAIVTREVRRGQSDPLGRLLAGAGTGRRGQGMTTPTDWSIERLTIESIAKTAPGGPIRVLSGQRRRSAVPLRDASAGERARRGP